MSKTARNGKVDLFKFIFSIVVIIYHFGNAVKFDNELFNKGYIGVEFFFIVSGFLFAKSIEKIPYHKEIGNGIGEFKGNIGDDPLRDD